MGHSGRGTNGRRGSLCRLRGSLFCGCHVPLFHVKLAALGVDVISVRLEIAGQALLFLFTYSTTIAPLFSLR